MKHIEWQVDVDLADGSLAASWVVKAPNKHGKVFEKNYAKAKGDFQFPKHPSGGMLWMDVFSGWTGYDDGTGKMIPLYKVRIYPKV